MHLIHLLIVAAVCGTITISVARWKLRTSPISLLRTITCIVIALMVAIMGSKLFSFWLSDLPLSELNLTALMSGGTRHPGTIAALLLIMPIVLLALIPKGWRLEMADAIALAMLLCMPLYRIICHINGCCVGGVCDEGYCMTYPSMSAPYLEQIRAGLIVPGAAQSLPVFPLHAFIVLSALSSFIVLFWFDRYKDYSGQLVLLHLFMNDGLKAILESWRVPYIPELQWASAMFAVLGLIGLIFFGWRQFRLSRSHCP